jgi:hypothetical protein
VNLFAFAAGNARREFHMVDPITEDDAAIDTRADEDAREKRWAHFSDVLADYLTAEWLQEVANAYRARHDADAFGPGRLAWHIQQFAESEGWPSAVAAIARAMREDAA